MVPTTRRVMDLFHVVHLAAEKLTACQQRGLTGARGKKIDPLFMSRKTLVTRIAYLTKQQWKRLEVLWQFDELMVLVQVT